MTKLEVRLRQEGQYFIPFITAGDPSLEASKKILYLLQEEGAAAIELGVPFSDPMADGPVIQAASERALAHNISLQDVLRLGKELREEGYHTPLILFTYFNPVLHYGLEALVEEAQASGFAGIIVPDLPYEESAPLRAVGKQCDFPVIPLVTPTSKERIESIVSDASGFVYCVSSLGTTGMRQYFADNVEEFLATARAFSPVPTAVGFGVSTGEHVRHFRRHADAVVVGSALVKKIEEAQQALLDPQQIDQALASLRQFVRQLKSE
ncbi:tryptophan synthase subunit alpha [Laceyella putida]|uniref:Tryptophan synthase alpha chain n=1 Tax=Laceyella putida TaxID=110101 RepID=A0ABW2RMF2_9BACL